MLYPPLTPKQLVVISHHVATILDAHHSVVLGVCPKMPTTEADVDALIESTAKMRGLVATLDHKLFQTWGLVHKLRNSNVPTSLPPAPRPKPPTASLEDLESIS